MEFLCVLCFMYILWLWTELPGIHLMMMMMMMTNIISLTKSVQRTAGDNAAHMHATRASNRLQSRQQQLICSSVSVSTRQKVSRSHPSSKLQANSNSRHNVARQFDINSGWWWCLGSAYATDDDAQSTSRGSDVTQQVWWVAQPYAAPVDSRPTVWHSTGNLNRPSQNASSGRTSCAGCRPNMPPPLVTLTLDFWPWKWCSSHVWRGLPLCQI